jgi:hypothetical protein
VTGFERRRGSHRTPTAAFSRRGRWVTTRDMTRKKRRSRRVTPTTAAPGARSGPAPAVAPPARPARLRRTLDVGLPILAAVAFLVAVLVLHPFRTYFEFDPDEGNNVIKALMLSRGHALYTEIWNDQAPLFTYALTWWFAMFGATVNAGRILVLLCSTVTIWGVYQMARVSWGHVHAWAAVVLLVLSPFYTVLSVSVMLGLPSLMWAVLSLLTLTYWCRQGRTVWLVLSALAMSLSVLTKLFTAFLVPILAVGIVVAEWGRRRGTPRRLRRLIPAVVWSAVFAASSVVILLAIIPPADLGQLVEPHLAARGAEQYVQRAEKHGINYWLFGAKGEVGTEDVMVLAAIGLLHIPLRRRWISLLVASWCLAAYVALWAHAPIWYHHLPLLMIPASLLGGIAVGEMVPRFGGGAESRRRFSTVARITLGLGSTACLIAVGLHGEDKLNRSSEYGSMVKFAPRDRFLTAVMKQYAPKCRYAFADRQMYAFRAGLSVPPELSVTSQKRLRSDNLTDEQIVESLGKYHPEIIVLDGWRMPMSAPLARFLRDGYNLIYADDFNVGPARNGVYVHPSMEGDSLAVLKAALKEAPNCPEAYETVGLRIAATDPEQAIRYYRKALELNAGRTRAWGLLAKTLIATGRLAEGFEAYRQGYRVASRWKPRDPRDAGFLSSYAWNLATSPDPQFRDGKGAEEVIHEAIQSRGPRAAYLDVLAAAYAEQGRFQDAIRTAAEAIQSATDRGQAGLARRIQRRLKTYQANRPYREEAAVPRF